MTENWECVDGVEMQTHPHVQPTTCASEVTRVGFPGTQTSPGSLSFNSCLVWAGRSSWSCTQKLPGRKQGPDEWCRKKTERALNDNHHGDDGCTEESQLPGCTPAAGGGQGEERRSWRRLFCSIPGDSFPGLPWRHKRSTTAGKPGPWLHELVDF